MRERISLAPLVYVALLMTPVYWLVAMSFKTNAEIGGDLTFYPPRVDARSNYALHLLRPRLVHGLCQRHHLCRASTS